MLLLSNNVTYHSDCLPLKNHIRENVRKAGINWGETWKGQRPGLVNAIITDVSLHGRHALPFELSSELFPRHEISIRFFAVTREIGLHTILVNSFLTIEKATRRGERRKTGRS